MSAITEKYINLHKDLSANNNNQNLLEKARVDAINLLQETNIPNNKHEDYKYSDFTKTLETDLKLSVFPETVSVDLNEFWNCKVPNLDTHVILLSNGWYYEKNQISEDLPEGVLICSLNEASEKYPEIFEKHYNKYAKTEDAYSLLNTAFAGDGVFVYVPENVKIEKTIQLVNLTHGFVDRFVMQRNLFIAENNSKLRIMICDHSLNLTQNMINNVTEAYLGSNAEMEVYSLQNEPDKSSVIKSLYFHQKEKSRLVNLALSLHAGMLRNNVNVQLTGERAEANLYGLFLNDRQQKVDNFILVEHDVPNCTSNQFYKGILDEEAQGSFQGRIHVKKDAQKTEAYQSNKNMCLTPDAKMHTKPQLEIYADDVRCSHGATVGQLDENAMFYLRSRGISEKEARLMLMYAFADEVVSKIELEPLRKQISGMVNSRLRGELSDCTHCLLNCSR